MAKTKEMILNTAREKTESVFLSGENWNLKKKKKKSADFSIETCRPEGSGMLYSKS